MSTTRTWKGGATLSVAQIDTLVFGGTWEVDDVVKITLEDRAGNTSTLSVTTGSTVIATLIATVVTAFNASTDPHFQVITAAASSPNITLTADNAGIPFTCTVTTTEAGGGAADAQTLASSTTTPNQGDGDYGTPANWWEGIVPIASDKVTIAGANSITYGLNQSSITLAGFVVAPDFTGQIGFNGAPLRIALNTDALVGGAGTNYLDLGASNVSVRFVSDDLPRDTTFALSTDDVDRSNYPFTSLKGSNLATLYIDGGRIEIARNAGVTSTVATIDMNAGTLRLGSGATLTTINQAGGNVELNCAAITVNLNRGVLTTGGTGAITTMNVAGGIAYPNSTGTISALNVMQTGMADFTTCSAVRTVSAMNIYGSQSHAAYDPRVVTVNASTGALPNQGSQS